MLADIEKLLRNLLKGQTWNYDRSSVSLRDCVCLKMLAVLSVVTAGLLFVLSPAELGENRLETTINSAAVSPVD